MKREEVLVRMLQTVTMGSNPTWPAGSVQLVPTALVKVLVSAGEAVVVSGLDATVCVNVSPMRTR